MLGGKRSRWPAMEDSLDADIYADAYGTDSQDLPFPANDASSALAGLQPGIVISSPPESSPFSGHLETPELQPPPPETSDEAARMEKGGMDVVSESLQRPLKDDIVGETSSKTKLSAVASLRISQSRGLVNDAHLRGKDVPVGFRREVEDEFGSISAKKKNIALVLEEDASLQSGKDDIAKKDRQEKSAFSVKLKNLPAILTTITGLCKSANADASDKEQLSAKEQTSNDDETAGCQDIPTDFLEAANLLCNITNRTSPTAENLDIIEIARRKGLQFPYLDDDSSCSDGFSP